MAVSLSASRVGAIFSRARMAENKTEAARILRTTKAGVWHDPQNPTILGDANVFGRLIPGRIWGGGLPQGITERTIGDFQKGILSLMPEEFRTDTTEEEKNQAALLILESHRRASMGGMPKEDDKPEIVEAMDREGCLTVVHEDYKGALEKLFSELHSRHYEIRSMRNFSAQSKFSELDMEGRRYAVSFIAPEGYSSAHGEKDKKEKEKTTLEFKKAKVLESINRSRLMPDVKTEKREELVDQYFKECLFETLNRRDAASIAKQIKGFNEINNRIHVWDMEVVYEDDKSNVRQKTVIRVGINDRHLTKLLAEICGVIKRAGGDIQSLTIDSIESVDKSICTFSLINEKTGKPIEDVLFDEIKRGIYELASKSLGRRSLVDTIIGPKMIPTSSSHTCGANRIARTVRKMIVAGFKAGFLHPKSTYSLKVEMINSFDLTEKGSGKLHYSDEAVVAGLFGILHYDEQLIGARDRLKTGNGKLILEEGLEHPVEISFNDECISSRQDRSLKDNPIRIILEESPSGGGDPIKHVFLGESTGGSAIEIYKIFGDDCNLQKGTKSEPIRGNTPTYFISLNGGEAVEAIKAKIENLGYKVVNHSAGPKRLVVCLDKKLKEDDVATIAKEAKGFAEVELIGDVVHAYSAPFSDIATLTAEAQRSGKRISEIAIEYEAGVKGQDEKEVRAQMRDLLGIMFTAVDSGLREKGPIFVSNDVSNDQVERWAIESNAHKLEKNATRFPYTLERFTEILKSTFELRRSTSGQVVEGRWPLVASGEESKNNKDWNFIITAPLVRAIFDRRGAETILPAKLMGGEITPEDPFVMELYKEITDYWITSPTISNIFPIGANNAIAVAEWNARRGLIVAAPTAGACGVIPGVLKAMKNYFKYSDDELYTEERLTEALFTAGLIGLLFNDKLRMNGGIGGCQAEIGIAAAMAAAAATELLGGDPQDISNAVAFALKKNEGLACTPIGGAVAYPCIIRNGFAATDALLAAVLGVNKYLSVLSPDAVIEGYIDNADKLHPSLRERGTGGIAGSKMGKELGRMLKNCKPCKGCS